MICSPLTSLCPSLTRQRVLIPLDGSTAPQHALRLAAWLRPDADPTLLRLVERSEDAPQALSDLRDAARAGSAPLANVLVQGTHDPAHLILAEVERGAHELVVLVDHRRRSVRRWLRGSLAERVLRHSVVPVLLGHPSAVRRCAAGAPRRVLVPVHGGAGDAALLARVQALCLPLGAEAALFDAVWVEPRYNALACSSPSTPRASGPRSASTASRRS